jgi:hypothetical protein
MMHKRYLRVKRFMAIIGVGFVLVLTANGKTATYQNNATWGNGSYTDNRDVTGFNGKTTNYQNDRTWGNGTYTDARSYTGVNGGTRTDTVSRSGGVVTNTFTGRNGNSRTVAHAAGSRRFGR